MGIGQKAASKGTLDLVYSLALIRNTVLSSESFSYARQAVLTIACEIALGVCSAASSSLSLFSSINSNAKAAMHKDCHDLSGTVYRLNALCNLPRDLLTAFDTSFLYHHIDILPTIVASIFSEVPT